MKKRISVLLVFAMMLSLITSGISTFSAKETKEKASVNGYICNVGDIIDISVLLKAPEILENFQGCMSYDDDGLHFCGYNYNEKEFGGYWIGNGFTELGKFYYSATDIEKGYDLTTKGVLFTAYFQVEKSGNYNVSNAFEVMSGFAPSEICGTSYVSDGVLDPSVETEIVVLWDGNELEKGTINPTTAPTTQEETTTLPASVPPSIGCYFPVNVNYELSYVTSSNTDTSATKTYSTILTPDRNYIMIEAYAIVNGERIDATPLRDSKGSRSIDLDNLTGTVTIHAKAQYYEELTTRFTETIPPTTIGCYFPVNATYDLNHVTSSSMETRPHGSYSTVLTPDEGYVITSAYVLMNGNRTNAVSNGDGTYSIKLKNMVYGFTVVAVAVDKDKIPNGTVNDYITSTPHYQPPSAGVEGSTVSQTVATESVTEVTVTKTEPVTAPTGYTKVTEPTVSTVPETVTTEPVTEVTVTVPVTEPTTVVEGTGITETEPATEETVTAPTEPATTKPVVKKTTVTLTKSSANLYVKGATSIKATVKNGKGTTTYKSSNPKIVKVDSKGKVTALKAGTAKITVTNNKVSKIFTVTVKNPKLNKTSVTLKKNKSFTLKITGKIGKAKFTTSNKKIVTVSKNGKIVAKKKGSATITVKTNGITLKCKVKVK